MTQPQNRQSKHAPYEPAWTAKALLAEQDALDEHHDDVVGIVEVVHRLAHGTTASWAPRVERAALLLREAWRELDDAIDDAAARESIT